jgi:hypothetical protein
MHVIKRGDKMKKFLIGLLMSAGFAAGNASTIRSGGL